MTNADTVLLASTGLNVSGKNPFTGKRFTDVQDKKIVHVYSHTENAALRNMTGNDTVWPIKDSTSWSVHDSIFEASNWTRLKDGK